eukprot:TRINITY_DN13519_c0_g1_i1.p1 TRINITY_DN13519_c0_g1~~TRINITY_DN13519_c0_g1_i1.p1  ORF type:complete len:347 (+),score=78.68 TRINITY_DN13519_c0_g1_i1:63-1103(+)
MTQLDPHYNGLKCKIPHDEQTVLGRYRLYARGMHPMLMLQGREKVKKVQLLLNAQKEAEAKGWDDVAPKEQLERAWNVNRWCTNDVNGRYIPFWGRLSFITIPTFLSTMANISSVYIVKDIRRYQMARLAAHTSSGFTFMIFAAYQSGGVTTTKLEKAGLITLSGLLATMTGLYGEYRASLTYDVVKRTFSHKVRGTINGSLTPAIGMGLGTMIVKSNEWAPFMITDAYIPVYDETGELVDKTSEAGYFAARETSVLRAGHAFLWGVLSFSVSQAVISQHSATSKKAIETLRRKTCLISFFLLVSFLASLPLAIGITPAHTSIASRRIDTEYQKAGIANLYYYRGL